MNFHICYKPSVNKELGIVVTRRLTIRRASTPFPEKTVHLNSALKWGICACVALPKKRFQSLPKPAKSVLLSEVTG